PFFSYLIRVTHRAYGDIGNGFESAEFPPLELRYSRFELDPTARPLEEASLDGLQALGTPAAEWVDLDGEGIPGVLLTTERAFFYKRNHGEGHLGPPVAERSLPSPSEVRGAGTQLVDVEGDGNLDLVFHGNPLSGWFARTVDKSWAAFRPLPNVPRIDWADPNLRFLDIDGDGHADVVITEHDAFLIYRSRARDGFFPYERVPKARDEQDGPAVVFSDAHEGIFLADMSGDGLVDIVRVRNGEVCYWPNLGYGRFGRKVVFEGTVRFARPDAFDPRRVRLADVDGTGVSDILYVGVDGIDVYLNESGNALAPPRRITSLPPVDSVANLTIVDLFGRGTSCLLWSSPSPGTRTRPAAFVDLVGPTKPHLLIGTDDSMGRSTTITYAASTEDYLRDRRAGRHWLSRLHFPVHVVRELVQTDAISRSTLRTRFAYHHGFFDGEEREFRGFACVDQTNDTIVGPAGSTDSAELLRQPPVRTTTWFHTGAWLERERLETALAKEYWSADTTGALLSDTPPLPGTTVREEREAARALRGAILRQEIYAEDGTAKAEHPYSISERSYAVRLLVPADGARHGVFFTHPLETIDGVYERNPIDPRVQHRLVLRVDDFGNVLESASVAYGRRTANADLPARFASAQTRTLVTYSLATFTAAIDDDTGHRTPLPAEVRTYELTGVAPSSGIYLSPEDVRIGFANATKLDYSEAPSGSGPARRRIEHLRTIYRADDLSGGLALGVMQVRALPFESYSLAFTPKLLSNVYRRGAEDLVANRKKHLETDGGYLSRRALVASGTFPAFDAIADDDDDDWWIPGGRVFFSETAKPPAAELLDAKAGFFLPRRARDPFGNDAIVRRDDYGLVLAGTEDAAGNRTTVTEIDYRVLQPRVVEDPNRNREEVWFDVLGLVIASGRMGKVTESKGDVVSVPAGASRMPAFSVKGSDIAAFLQTPTTKASALVGTAGRRFVYDLFAYQRTRSSPVPSPPVVATIARTTHEHDAAGGTSGLQIALLYFDGFARTVQTKTLAEDGPLDPGGPSIGPRWVGSAWIVFDDKGNPVRKYEPFFSNQHTFEHGRKSGPSTTLLRDPLDRVVATLLPNHAYEKVVFDAWTQAHWDADDTSAVAPEEDTDIGARVLLLPSADYSPAWKDRAPMPGREA
ncbi:MAG TPA: toxin TcdB middle/N-terminal domain-containing protein, partial [Labilithrix sp.]|nr:toxin TcdB middle/N-terminal domain-containing protein [Labilithrix sp.]